MLWYDGSIENAVHKVKSTGSFLLVFVQGYDNLSKEYESCLNKITGLKDETYVAVKLKHDSTALEQFKQIYVKVPVPSVFLIQNNGVPLHVVATDKVSEICTEINKTMLAVNDKVKNRNAVTKSTNKNIEKPHSKPLEHAKNIGYKIADVSEGELKQRLNEIRAFPRFLLIDSSTNLDPDRDPVFPPVTDLQPPKTHSARIQFRLPNNDTPSWEFPDLSTLNDIRAYIMEKVDLPPNFKFMRTYPRTAFTPRDEHRTLSDLCLTPNATLIVVPVKFEDKNIQANPSDTSRPFFLTAVLNALLLPLFTIVKFFKKHIFGERADVMTDEIERSRPATTIGKNQKNQKLGSNIHGFKFDRDDSDGEHPDNGNSTQQSYGKK